MREQPDSLAAFVAATEDLLAVLDQLSAERRPLARRAQQVRKQLASGRSLTDVVQAEEPPLIVATLRESTARFTEAFSRFQRAEARALHDEGMSMERIGRLFGVSRQRVAHLVEPPAPA